MNHRFDYITVIGQDAGMVDRLPVQREVNSCDACQGEQGKLFNAFLINSWLVSQIMQVLEQWPSTL